MKAYLTADRVPRTFEPGDVIPTLGPGSIIPIGQGHIWQGKDVFPGVGFIEMVDRSGDDQSVVRSARVSFNGDQEVRPPEKDAKLIRYMLRHGHWSPFEHAGLTVHVEAPIFVARQWMRHRSQSFNELSGRYQELEARAYTPQSWRSQSTSNRQASGEDLPPDEAWRVDEDMRMAYEAAWAAYDRMIQRGVAREQARTVLPLGTFTRFYATMNLRSALHFIGDRDHPDAQAEIAQYARAIGRYLNFAFPMVWDAWQEVRS